MKEPCVDRCVCHERSFAELLETARRHDVTQVADLRAFVDFGQGCGTCLPYVRLALATGKTRLPLLSAEAS